jgi:hypothetical protein
MPTIRPDGDVTNNWTKSSGTQGFAAIDDPVTPPTDASTAGDGLSISSVTSGQVQECSLQNPSLAVGQIVPAVEVHAYVAGGSKRGVQIDLVSALGMILTTISVAAGAAAAWQSVTLTQNFTAVEVNDLRVRFTTTSTSGGGATAATVYAAYVNAVTPSPVHERSAAVSGASGVAAGGVRFGVFARASVVSGTSTVAVAGVVVRVHSRSAAIAGTCTVATAPQRILVRSVAVVGAGAVGATGAISATGSAVGAGAATQSRAVAFGGQSGVASAGLGWSVFTGSVTVAGFGSVGSVGRRDVIRSVTLSSIGSVTVTLPGAPPSVVLGPIRTGWGDTGTSGRAADGARGVLAGTAVGRAGPGVRGKADIGTRRD